MKHICVSKQTIIGSVNGLSPGRRQAIIWTNAGILLIGPLGTKFNEILIEIQIFSFKKMHLKMSSGKWRSFCLGLNVLKSILVGSAVYLMVVIRQDMLNTLVPVRIAYGFCVSYQQLFALADQVVDWFTYGPKPCNYRDLRMSTQNGKHLLPTPQSRVC